MDDAAARDVASGASNGRYDRPEERYDTGPKRYDTRVKGYDARTKSYDKLSTGYGPSTSDRVCRGGARFLSHRTPYGRHDPDKRLTRAHGFADSAEVMKRAFYVRRSLPPVSNTERQRKFRQRNPDYYRLLKARERAATRARFTELKAIEAFKRELQLAPPLRPVLMLPAPVADPTMAAIDAIRASLQSTREVQFAVAQRAA